MSDSAGSKSSPSHQTLDPMSSSACSMAIQHQHHHHFYSHPVVDPSSQHSHHHLHHHHFQSQSAALASTSVLSAASDSTISSVSSSCCPRSGTCQCSSRLMTGIVITILPIAITSTLICVFFLQKTNLHQYAIYSFVIFCVAFVFPFALFFFMVIMKKIYKFYKREIRSNPRQDPHLSQFLPDSCEPGMIHSSAGYNLQPTAVTPPPPSSLPGRAMLVQPGPSLPSHQAVGQSGQNASLICYSSRGLPYHPYYYHIDDGTIVTYAPSESATVAPGVVIGPSPATVAAPAPATASVIIEDSPPSYEMALLCPSVTHHHQYPIQVIISKEQSKDKMSIPSQPPVASSIDSESAAPLKSEVTKTAATNAELETKQDDHEPDRIDNVSAQHSNASSEDAKSLDDHVIIPTG